MLDMDDIGPVRPPGQLFKLKRYRHECKPDANTAIAVSLQIDETYASGPFNRIHDVGLLDSEFWI